MAHEIDFSNDRANMAFRAKDGACWHNLGFAMNEDQSMEQWIEAAGFNHTIESAPVEFNGDVFPGQVVLYRSDTKAPLSIVSDKFKVVQPKEVMDFFQEMIAFDGMKMSTAGMLKGGNIFWAMVSTGREFDAGNGDIVSGNIILTTGVDGMHSTRAISTSIRAVCSNTLSWALKSKTESRNHARTTHSQEWDPDMVKKSMGLFDAGWSKFQTNILKLTNTTISSKAAENFMYNLVSNPNKDADEQSYTVAKSVELLMSKFRNGIGNSGKTAWDMVNAVTECVDYGLLGNNGGLESKATNSMFGKGAALKTNAYEMALCLE